MKPADLWELLAAVPLHHSVEFEVDGLTADDATLDPVGGGVAVLELILPDGWSTTPLEPNDDMLAAGMKATAVPMPPHALRAIWRTMHAAVNGEADK